MIDLSLYIVLTTKLASEPIFGTPSMMSWPPQARRSVDVLMRAVDPTHSKTWSAPFGQISLTAATRSKSGPSGQMKCVAPNWRAYASFVGVVSTAMIGRPSESAAPWITLSPMPPTPMTTTDWPCDTFARLNTAPTPVRTPQPMSEAEANGTSLEIGMADVPLTTVSSTKTEVLANWKHLSPSTVNGRVSLPRLVRQNV